MVERSTERSESISRQTPSQGENLFVAVGGFDELMIRAYEDIEDEEDIFSWESPSPRPPPAKNTAP